MKLFRLMLAALAGLGFQTALAVAADPLAQIYNGPSGSIWDGVFFGIGASATDSGSLGIGGTVGVNKQSDQLVYGLLFDGALLSTGDVNLQASGRLGFLPTDEFLLYGLAGLGAHTTYGPYASFGGGVEFALSDSMSIRAEAQHGIDLDTSIGYNVVVAGLNFHF
ncbi:MAG TPA: hypothetical protein VG757_00905 [Devosia sp.]|nr:hypothetical protein [Devosia sp.]